MSKPSPLALWLSRAQPDPPTTGRRPSPESQNDERVLFPPVSPVGAGRIENCPLRCYCRCHCESRPSAPGLPTEHTASIPSIPQPISQPVPRPLQRGLKEARWMRPLRNEGPGDGGEKLKCKLLLLFCFILFL